jgi:hypothetical protein
MALLCLYRGALVTRKLHSHKPINILHRYHLLLVWQRALHPGHDGQHAGHECACHYLSGLPLAVHRWSSATELTLLTWVGQNAHSGFMFIRECSQWTISGPDVATYVQSQYPITQGTILSSVELPSGSFMTTIQASLRIKYKAPQSSWAALILLVSVPGVSGFTYGA